MSKKRWRVTQDAYSNVTGQYIESISREYRFRWYARFVAFMYKGESAGLGLRTFKTRVEEL